MKPAKASLFVLSDCIYDCCDARVQQACPGCCRAASRCKGFCPASQTQTLTIDKFAFQPKELAIAGSGQSEMECTRPSSESLHE